MHDYHKAADFLDKAGEKASGHSGEGISLGIGME